MIKCPECHGDKVVISHGKTHTGVYCSACGKWIKWASKKEVGELSRAEKIVREINNV